MNSTKANVANYYTSVKFLGVIIQPSLLFEFFPQILEELLKKLEIDHVTWSIDKKVHFHQIIFPIQSGDPCETTLHCLTELGIGSKLKSTIRFLYFFYSNKK